MGVMALKNYYTFPKVPGLVPYYYEKFSDISRIHVWREPNPSVGMQLVYSTASAEWAVSFFLCIMLNICLVIIAQPVP